MTLTETPIPPLWLRVYTIIADALLLALLTVVPTATLVVFAAPGMEVITGIWAGLVSLMAAPPLVLLYVSRPRERWSQRSALIASGLMFGRTVWGGAVFALSIVLGAVTGIVASRVSDSEKTMGDAVRATIDAIAVPFVGQTLLVVAGVAYAWMGLRWVVDLTAFRREGAALKLCAYVEHRWLPESAYLQPDARDRIVAVLFHLGRGSLVLVLIAVGATLIPAAWASLQS